MTTRLDAFAPMREVRVKGKGGQFADGGGRVPGGQGSASAPTGGQQSFSSIVVDGPVEMSPARFAGGRGEFENRQAWVAEDGTLLAVYSHESYLGVDATNNYVALKAGQTRVALVFEGTLVESTGRLSDEQVSTVRQIHAQNLKVYENGTRLNGSRPELEVEIGGQYRSTTSTSPSELTRLLSGEWLTETDARAMSESFREFRAAGKGGQFAKGGGRVPAGAGRFSGMTATQALASVSDEEVHAMYGTFEHEGFTSRVDTITRDTNDGETYGGSIGVSGVVLAPDGSVAGRFSRVINPQPRVGLVEATRAGIPEDHTMTLEVHHDVFFLNRDLRGQGVGGAFIEQTMTRAKEAGLERVTVHALSSPGKSNGALVWAKEGFEMRQGSDSLAIRMRARLKGEAMRHLPAEARSAFQALSARVLKGKASMSELLATPDGVAVLLGENGTVTWDGAMRL